MYVEQDIVTSILLIYISGCVPAIFLSFETVPLYMRKVQQQFNIYKRHYSSQLLRRYGLGVVGK